MHVPANQHNKGQHESQDGLTSLTIWPAIGTVSFFLPAGDARGEVALLPLLDFAPCSHNQAGHDTLRLLAASDKMELTVRLCKKKTCLCQQINTTKANVGAKMARLIDNLTSGTYCVLLFPLGDAPREATLLLFHRHRNSSPRSKFAHTSNLHNLSNAIIRVVDALLLNEPFQVRSQSRTELRNKCSLTGTIFPTKAACAACCRSRYA
jgi:hypothetical protein